MIRQLFELYRILGMGGLVDAAFSRVLHRRLACYTQYESLFDSKIGLEIGGPSAMFRRTGLVPVYAIAARIDNVNYASQTVWDGKPREGDSFHFDKRKAPGREYVAEACNLGGIASASYEFVLSSHCLEHVANPLQALAEWTRVLKEEGPLVLVVPHRDGTFDHRRPVTPLEHLIHDCSQQTTEGDMTHLDEILRLHDLTKDPWAGNYQAFKKRSMQNMEHRCLHHHVFDTRLAVETVHYMGLQLLAVEILRPFHIVLIGQKPRLGKKVENDRFRGIQSAPCWVSPFPSDRRSDGTLRPL